MQVVFDRFVEEPHIPLVPGAAPEVVGSFRPAIEDGLILALVVGPAESESILRPDDEGGPFAAGLSEGLLQRIQFAGGHADVAGALGDCKQVGEGCQQKSKKVAAQVVIQNGAALAAHFILGRVPVIDVIRGICEHHIRQLL